MSFIPQSSWIACPPRTNTTYHGHVKTHTRNAIHSPMIGTNVQQQQPRDTEGQGTTLRRCLARRGEKREVNSSRCKQTTLGSSAHVKTHFTEQQQKQQTAAVVMPACFSAFLHLNKYRYHTYEPSLLQQLWTYCYSHASFLFFSSARFSRVRVGYILKGCPCTYPSMI